MFSRLHGISVSTRRWDRPPAGLFASRSRISTPSSSRMETLKSEQDEKLVPWQRQAKQVAQWSSVRAHLIVQAHKHWCDEKMSHDDAVHRYTLRDTDVDKTYRSLLFRDRESIDDWDAFPCEFQFRLALCIETSCRVPSRVADSICYNVSDKDESTPVDSNKAHGGGDDHDAWMLKGERDHDMQRITTFARRFCAWMNDTCAVIVRTIGPTRDVELRKYADDFARRLM